MRPSTDAIGSSAGECRAVLCGTAGSTARGLLEAEIGGDLPPFLLFWGHTARAEHSGPWVLSQWWPSPFDVEGITYLHAEGYMMAEKARVFGDESTRQRIITTEHPAEAKTLGRLVRGFDETAWAGVRFDLVVQGNLAKC